MRNLKYEHETHARRPGDRTDVAHEPNLTELLASEAIRLARLATSVHLTEQARRMVEAPLLGPRPSIRREPRS